MKKWLKISFIIILVIVTLSTGYNLLQICEDNQADKVINSAFEKSGMPSDQMIVIVKTNRQLNLFGYGNYHKILTTKKDYEFWKQEVQKRGKLFSGKSFDKAFLQDPKNCELYYWVDYRARDTGKFDASAFSIQISAYGDSKTKDGINENLFAYRPDKLYFAQSE